MRRVRIKRRGVTVNGKRLRQLRQTRGWTQQELATITGVAERTLRNAEASQYIRVDFVRFLATALGVETVDLVADRSQLRVFATEDKTVNNLLQATLAYAFHRDLSEYRQLMSPNIRLRLPGPETIPFAGEYRGFNGVQTLMDCANETVAHDEGLDFSDIRTGGNLVVIQFTDSGRVLKTGKHYRSACQYVYEFERGRIVRVDNFFDTKAILDALAPSVAD